MTKEEIFNMLKNFQNEFSLRDGTVEYADDYDIVLWIEEYLGELENEI